MWSRLIVSPIRKTLSIIVISALMFSNLALPKVFSGEMVNFVLPKPGTMVALSPSYTPAHLQGIIIHPENALKFDFLVNKGNGNLSESEKEIEYKKLIKYFLASLTVPDKDQWVNLSPYEKNRIIEDNFGKTEMGRDLLSQEYLLKQITSSLMFPESGLGKEFWNKVYERADKEYGTTNIPVNSFNKVWIVPDDAVIYESGNTAYILKNHLKVMLEKDYLSLRKSNIETRFIAPVQTGSMDRTPTEIIRQIILPSIEKEVNEGKNFSLLRQIANSMLLATWYKKALKESLLGKVYTDKAKVQNLSLSKDSIRNPEYIYHQYLKAYRKGVYNFIKEDTDILTHQPIQRKYFSGGWDPDYAQVTHTVDSRSVDPAVIALAENAAKGEKQIDLAAVALNPDTRISRRAFLLSILAGIVSIFVSHHHKAFARELPMRAIDVSRPISKLFWRHLWILNNILHDPRDFSQQRFESVFYQLEQERGRFLENIIGGAGVYLPSKELPDGTVIKIDSIIRYNPTGSDQEIYGQDKIKKILGQVFDIRELDGRTYLFVGELTERSKPIRYLTVLVIDPLNLSAITGEKGLKVNAAMSSPMLPRRAVWQGLVVGAFVGVLGLPAAARDRPLEEPGDETVSPGKIPRIVNGYPMFDRDMREYEQARAQDDQVSGIPGEWFFDKHKVDFFERDMHEVGIQHGTFSISEEQTYTVGDVVNYETEFEGFKIPESGRILEMRQVKDKLYLYVLVGANPDERVEKDIKVLVVDIPRVAQVPGKSPTANAAMRSEDLGGIDFNSANFNVQIKRDVHGVPLPISQQDLAQLSRVSGFEPDILEIKPAGSLPFLSELIHKA